MTKQQQTELAGSKLKSLHVASSHIFSNQRSLEAKIGRSVNTGLTFVENETVRLKPHYYCTFFLILKGTTAATFIER